jgi:hypothetical protein
MLKAQEDENQENISSDKIDKKSIDQCNESKLAHLLDLLIKETESLALTFKVTDIDLLAKNIDASRNSTISDLINLLLATKKDVMTLKKSDHVAIYKYAEKIIPALNFLISQAKKSTTLKKHSKKVTCLIVQINRILHKLIEKMESQFSQTETLIEEVTNEIADLDATLQGRLDNLESAFEACCLNLESRIDEICDITDIESTVEACCFSLESKLDHLTCSASCSVTCELTLVESLVETCCFSLASQIDNLTCIATCDLTPIESIIESCCFSLESKFDVVVTLSALEACCSEIGGLIISIGGSSTNQYLSLSSMINNLTETFTACCTSLGSQLDNLICTVTCDLTPIESLIESCCFSLESKLDNLHFVCTATCDLTPIESTIESCCFSLESKLDILLTETCTGIVVITSPTTISMPGHYILCNDVGPGASPTITIMANSVLLDLNGHQVLNNLTDAGSPGILVSNSENIVITNGFINNTSGFSSIPAGGACGILFDATGPLNISVSNIVFNHWDAGIRFEGSSNPIFIQNIQGSNNNIGLDMQGGAFSAFISQCNFSGNQNIGINFGADAVNNRVDNCLCTLNNGDGMYVDPSAFGLSVSGSNFNFNGGNGVTTSGQGVQFVNCQFNNNIGSSVDGTTVDGHGILIAGDLLSVACQLIGTDTICTCTLFFAGEGTVVKDCLANSNAQDGYRIENAINVQLLGCTSQGNTGNGFGAPNSAFSGIVQGCTTNNNLGYGFTQTTTFACSPRWYQNYSHGNAAGNYFFSPNITAANFGVISDVVCARGYDNVDLDRYPACSPPEVVIESKLEECCFSLESKLDILLTFTETCSAIPVVMPTTITVPGHYCLARPLTDVGPIIQIDSSDVTLDLNGNTLFPLSDAAIALDFSTSRTTILIHNGFLEGGMGGDTGILIPSVNAAGLGHSNIQINNVSINEFALEGISAANVTKLSISDVELLNNAENLFTTTSTEILIEQSEFIRATVGSGALMQNCQFVTIKNSQFNENNVANFIIDDSTGGKSAHFIFDHCSFIGSGTGFIIENLDISSSTCFELFNCIADGNAFNGFVVIGAVNDVLFKECVSTHNGNSGFYTGFAGGFVPPQSISFVLSSAKQNSLDGFRLNNGTHGYVKGCEAVENTLCGFNVYGTDPILYRFINDVAQGNGSNPAGDPTPFMDSNYCLNGAFTPLPAVSTPPYFQIAGPSFGAGSYWSNASVN